MVLYPTGAEYEFDFGRYFSTLLKMNSTRSQFYQHGHPTAAASVAPPSSNMFRYEPTAGDASRIKSVVLNLQGRRLGSLECFAAAYSSVLGKMLEKKQRMS